MNFVESVKTCFSKYATFSGRASRSEFWWFNLFAFIVKTIANVGDSIFIGTAHAQEAVEGAAPAADIAADAVAPATDVAAPSVDNIAAAMHSPTPVLSLIVALALFLPSISVGARRLHDVNKSGWWQLIAITIIGIIPLLIWFTKKSDEGSNRFGDNPL